MKKIIAILLSITCLLSACGKESASSIANAPDDNYRNYYEIFVYSFADSDNNGIGDLKGVQDKLDYVENLGCNGIWLMPVMPSTTYHKYDVTDYYDIDEQYGTLEDFDSLVSECHARKIRLIIDLVMNHTSSKHPWFVQACEYLKTLSPGQEMDASLCPYINYYHFTNEKKDQTYYQVPGTEFYYEAQFWSEMPDLNLADEGLKKEFEKIADFWIEHGVDGFRMDAALHFEEGETEFNCQTLDWLYSYCKASNPDFYMVSEVWASEDKIKEYYKSNTPSMFDFAIADAEGDIVKTARGSESAERFVNKVLADERDYEAENPDYINAPFISNHDMSRVANALQSNADQIKMSAALLLSLGGSPYIYYGEELGMKSKGKKDENKRLPMIWSDKDSSYICDGPIDADKDIEQKFAGAIEQIEDETSIYNFYKKCLEVRNNNPEIARGRLDVLDEYTGKNIAVTSRTYNDSKIYIIYNTGDEGAEIDLSGLLNKDNWIEATISLNKDANLSQSILSLDAKSIVYIK